VAFAIFWDRGLKHDTLIASQNTEVDNFFQALQAVVLRASFDGSGQALAALTELFQWPKLLEKRLQL
jgi:hypothetical protein